MLTLKVTVKGKRWDKQLAHCLAQAKGDIKESKLQAITAITENKGKREGGRHGTLWLRPRMRPFSDSNPEGVTPVTEIREKYRAGLR